MKNNTTNFAQVAGFAVGFILAALLYAVQMFFLFVVTYIPAVMLVEAIHLYSHYDPGNEWPMPGNVLASAVPLAFFAMTIIVLFVTYRNKFFGNDKKSDKEADSDGGQRA